MTVTRYSEPYRATGGLAAEGVINQLGRPDIEPLEVLVREAVQNCWDAKRSDERGIRVEIGRRTLDGDEVTRVRTELLVDPPPGLPLAGELQGPLEVLHFADFGTSGLGGPTRADESADGQVRDFVDFVRNMGQPPDKELAGGSFGYGKAAFYIASRASTVVVDTLCEGPDGLERRLIGCGLGENFNLDGRPYTGRHWWGTIIDGVPEPLTGLGATAAAALLGLPERTGRESLGTTIAIIAPGISIEGPEGDDATMAFIAEALSWNFWPRMIATAGGAHATMRFRLTDQGQQVRVPDPRTDDRLRGFVEAMERLREEPDGDEVLVLDRQIECLRPARRLGRLVIQQGPVAPVSLPDRPVPEGARKTAQAVHHVALMRNAELIVKYLRGPEAVTGRYGYSGVFRCAVDVDEAFRRAEPPTHDDWVFRFVPAGHERTFVKVALERIARVCREAAGYDAALEASQSGGDVPLGEFADALAALMPGMDGPGARRPRGKDSRARPRRRNGPGVRTAGGDAAGDWTDGVGAGNPPTTGPDDSGGPDSTGSDPTARPSTARPPQIRSGGDPHPAIAADGIPVLRFPFELRGFGSRLRLSATVEVMTNDGAQMEVEPPYGYTAPAPRAWHAPDGHLHEGAEILVEPQATDGSWSVEVPLRDEAMVRVNVIPAIA